MKTWIQTSLLLCLFVLPSAAQESQPPKGLKIIHVYDWKELNLQVPGSEIISTGGAPILKIETTNDQPLEVSLLTITNPAIIKRAGSFWFDVKYDFPGRKATDYGDNLETDYNGYGKQFRNRLELFSSFPPAAPGGDETTGGVFNAFGGTHNWRRVVSTWGGLPTRLELKLFLRESGTFYLRPIQVVDAPHNANGSWWPPEQAGLIGGIGGSAIGCLGGLIGWLAGRGRARKFVLTTVKALIGAGVFLMIAGLAAVLLNQPYAVWYVLLLPGVILVLVFSLNFHSIQRRYDELEIRRMTSMDTMGG
jgi:hypothetical protein